MMDHNHIHNEINVQAQVHGIPPRSAALVALCAIVVSAGINIMPTISHIHIPPVCIELAQVFCWISGGLVASVSFAGWLKMKIGGWPKIRFVGWIKVNLIESKKDKKDVK